MTSKKVEPQSTGESVYPIVTTTRVVVDPATWSADDRKLIMRELFAKVTVSSDTKSSQTFVTRLTRIDTSTIASENDKPVVTTSYQVDIHRLEKLTFDVQTVGYLESVSSFAPKGGLFDIIANVNTFMNKYRAVIDANNAILLRPDVFSLVKYVKRDIHHVYSTRDWYQSLLAIATMPLPPYLYTLDSLNKVDSAPVTNAPAVDVVETLPTDW